MSRKFWYLATPYAKWKGGVDDAAVLAAMATALLVAEGMAVFSPIVHSHPLSKHLPNRDHDFWLGLDRAYLDASVGTIVLLADGWKDSRGVAWEEGYTTGAFKPLVRWDQAAPAFQVAYACKRILEGQGPDEFPYTVELTGPTSG